MHAQEALGSLAHRIARKDLRPLGRKRQQHSAGLSGCSSPRQRPASAAAMRLLTRALRTFYLSPV
jgi:hypothetical protein